MHLLLSLVLAMSAKADGLRAFVADQEVVTCSITEIVPALNEQFAQLNFGDMVIFDLDNTLFREAQLLGTDEWWAHATQRLTATGLSEREAALRLSATNSALKAKSKMRLMEPCMPRLIKSLQDRGVWVIGLTARHPDLSDSTITRLHELGIFLENSLPFVTVKENLKPFPDREFQWRGNIAFTDGAAKGPTVKAIMSTTSYRPAKAMIFDDRIDHVYTLAEALRDLRIPGHVVHYLKSREEIFEPEIADLQLRHFLATEVILSDRRARRRLSCAAALARVSENSLSETENSDLR